MVKTMRLIDADALTVLLHDDIDGLDEEFPNDKQVKPYMCGVRMALSFIDTAPTIDAVPVEVVADMFGEVPCNYAFCARQVDDFMYEQCDGWCEDKCGEVPTIECWKRFFKAWVERKDDE